MPNFKLIQQALLPVLGSWVDATHMVALFVFMALAAVCLLRGLGGGWVRRAVQLGAFVVFVIAFHRCLCMVRGAWQGFQSVGADDLSAYGSLCLALPIAAFTMVFGRVFCGWLCPLGFALDLLGRVARAAHKHLSRRLVLLVWCAVVALALVPTIGWLPATFVVSESAAMLWAWAALLCVGAVLAFPSWDAALQRLRTFWALLWIGTIAVGVFVTNPWCTAVGGELDYASLTGLVVALLAGTLVSMGWCRYVCPAGTFQGWLSRFAYVRHQPGVGRASGSSCAAVCPTGALTPEGIRHSDCIVCGSCARLCGYTYRSDSNAAAQRPDGAKLKSLSILVALASVGAYGLCAWAPRDTLRSNVEPASTLGVELRPAGSHWYTFGGNCRRDGFADVSFPFGPLRQRWKVRPTDRTWHYQNRMGVWSSGVAMARVGSRALLFAGYYDHNLYAFDTRNGRVRWKFTTGGVPTQGPTFALIDGRPVVFVIPTDRTMYALAADTGRRLWAFETHAWKDTLQPSIGSSPIVLQVAGAPRLIFCTWTTDRDPLRSLQAGEVISLDARQPQRPVWRVTLDTVPLMSPALALTRRGPVVIVASVAGRVWGLDAGTGSVVWHFATVSKMACTPSVGRCADRVAAFVGDRFGLVYALDAETGKQIWERKTGHMVDATPTHVRTDDGGLVLAASYDRSLHALDMDTGKPRWRIPTGDYVTATPCALRLGDGFGAFFWSLDNQVYLVKLDDGSLVWQSRTDPFLWTHATRGETRFSSPCAGLDADGRPIVVLPAYDGYLYCFGPDS